MTDFNTTPKERYVSLYGFFSFDYPQQWKNEVDEAGNYVFYDDKGGSGVVRILTIQNEETAIGSDQSYLDKVLQEQNDFDAVELKMKENRWIHFVQIHDLDQTEFTVYYWVTAAQDKIIIVTYTVQSMMKELPVSMNEKEQVQLILSSLTFMHGEAKEEHSHPH